MKKYKTQTASEFLKHLESDPEYIERTNKVNEKLRKAQLKRAMDEKPIFDELVKNGFEIDKIAETESCLNFVIDSKAKTKAIPILLKHIDLDYSEIIRDSLYRTFKTPLARNIVGQELIKRFKKETPELRWVIGHVLDTVATENDLDDIIILLNNPKYGKSRSELVLVVSRLMGKQAIPILINIIEKEIDLNEINQLVMNAITELGNLQATEGKKYIEQYCKHKDGEYRILAKKALRKLNKVNQIVTKLPKNISFVNDNVFSGKYEASTSLDLGDAIKFIKLLSTKINIDAEALENLVLDTEIQQTKTYKISLKNLLGSTELYFQILMEDSDTATIYFFSNSKSLIKTINKELSTFLD